MVAMRGCDGGVREELAAGMNGLGHRSAVVLTMFGMAVAFVALVVGAWWLLMHLHAAAWLS